MMKTSNTHLSKPKKSTWLWTSDDLAYAFECAADFLEAEEWPEDDGGAQVAAYREAAKRVRRMADRLYAKGSGGPPSSTTRHSPQLRTMEKREPQHEVVREPLWFDEL